MVKNIAKWFADTNYIGSFETNIEDFFTEREDEINRCDNIDELTDLFTDWNFEQEIIYYKEAFEYLNDYIKETNDYSMTTIFEVAGEYGYKPEDLNSTILATILWQHLNAREFYDLIEENNPFETDDDDEDIDYDVEEE